MLPKGKYVARATQWDLGFTSSGTPQIAVVFDVTEGDHKGETINWFGFFTEKTEERTFESLRIMGWKGVDLANVDNLDENEVQIVVDHEDYTDKNTGEAKTSARVQWVNKLGGGLALKHTMDAGQKASFAREMKARLLAFDAGRRAQQGSSPQRGSQQSRPSSSGSSGQRQGGAHPPEPPPIADDSRYGGPYDNDIPF